MNVRVQSAESSARASAGATRVRSAEVAVLMGGRSGEREISLLSGAAIARALRDDADGRGPARVHDVEIGADGSWIVGGRGCAPEEALQRFSRECVWFLALHGGAGEDGTIQGLLGATGRLHTGSGVAASALCMSKSHTRDVLSAAGIAVAHGFVIDSAQWRDEREHVLARASDLGSDGVAVKPDRGGSSVATFIVRAKPELPAAIESALAADERVVLEACILGAEATCGVIGDSGNVRALTPVEIVPKAGRFFDYEEKYSATGADEHCPPVSIGLATCARIQEIALRAFRAAGCEGYARVDFMIPRADVRDGDPGREAVSPRSAASARAAEPPRETEPIVLEINTLPGMTARSLLPRAAAEAGSSYRDLCLEIVHLALERGPR
jgi:D-alanine-D-alanine ligase